MNRIKSFTINHNVLVPGFYISREDGDVITYDLRTRKPNAGDYMDNASMHSLEHMFDGGGRCILWTNGLSDRILSACAKRTESEGSVCNDKGSIAADH